LRRDGNCFYRAFLFQFFEWFILNKSSEKGKAAYEAFLKCVEDSKADLVTNAGYDEIAIDDFHNMLLTAVKDLANVEPEKC
jgi:folate-dependent phosphoribosylglycinamide formyltransferase PurN